MGEYSLKKELVGVLILSALPLIAVMTIFWWAFDLLWYTKERREVSGKV